MLEHSAESENCLTTQGTGAIPHAILSSTAPPFDEPGKGAPPPLYDQLICLIRRLISGTTT